MLVSCVIPTFNYARFLPFAIESALAQTHREMEVLVVDDGSTDASDEVLRSYGGRIRCFRQANQGVSAARNLGIREARGEFVGFLDADDIWLPTKIERQVALMGGGDVGLVHCWFRDVDAEGKVIRVVRGGMRGLLLADHAQFRSTVLGGGSGALIRRRCFDEVGDFDLQLSTSADWDMWRRIIGRYRTELVEEPLLDYRIHGSGMHHNTEVYERDMLHALDKMFSDPIAADILPLKRIVYAKLYGILAAEYYLRGERRTAIRYAVNSVVLSPDPITHILLRKVRQQFGTNRAAAEF